MPVTIERADWKVWLGEEEGVGFGSEAANRPSAKPSVTNTGARSTGEELMACNTSAVAVSRCSASAIAITACAAKLFSSSICLSENGRTSWRYTLIVPRRASYLFQGHQEFRFAYH